MFYNWIQPKALPWWAGVGPVICGFLQLYNHFVPGSLGLFGALLDAGLDGTPPFALIYLGTLLLYATKKIWPHL